MILNRRGGLWNRISILPRNLPPDFDLWFLSVFDHSKILKLNLELFIQFVQNWSNRARGTTLFWRSRLTFVLTAEGAFTNLDISCTIINYYFTVVCNYLKKLFIKSDGQPHYRLNNTQQMDNRQFNLKAILY